MFRGGKVTLFEIPELDYMATKRQVMKAMDKYEWCLMRIDTNSHPKITQTFSLELSAFGGGFHSSTEDAAIYAVEGWKEHEVYLMKIVDCINRLKTEYRQIAVYCLIDRLQDYEASDRMGLSYSNYSMKKREVIELVAFGLECEVYLKSEIEAKTK